jgi:hypothetical protein
MIRLFEPVVEEARQHQNFRNLMRQGNGYMLDVLNDWARGFIDRDGKFVAEFQTSFNPCFWELYIFAVLKHYGIKVDFSKVRPDFFIPEFNFNIEATVASNSPGAEPEHAPLPKRPPPDLNAFNRKTIIRLSNSLTIKHRKYIESYAALSHVKNRPFVVAIVNFDQPFSYMTCQRPIEAVLFGYYVDEERYIAAGRREGRLEGQVLRRVFKDNNSPIELGLFTTPAYEEISAVIFSSCATVGKVRALCSDPNSNSFFFAFRLNPSAVAPHVIQQPKRHYEEHLLDGLRIYHNPYAANPLDPAIFRHPSVFQSYFQDEDWVYEQREGQLLSRFVFTLMQKIDA